MIQKRERKKKEKPLKSAGKSTPSPALSSVINLKTAIPSTASTQALRLNSVMAEERLTSAITRLNASPKLSSLSKTQIGVFWRKEWPRAPFEEELTFGQISQMKPRSLLEKRSFSQQKLQHLVETIEAALADDKVPAAPQKSSLSSNTARSPQAFTGSGHWGAELNNFPISLQGNLTQLLDEINQISDKYPIKSTLSKIPDNITALEFISAFLMQEHDQQIVASLLKVSTDTVQAATSSAYEKIALLLKLHSASISEVLEALLKMPAISNIAFAEIIFNDLPKTSYRLLLTTLIVNALKFSRAL